MSNDLINRHDIVRGVTVECPRRSSVGPHTAVVTHTDPVGTEGTGRTVVSLSCGHDINMSNWHGLYRAVSP